MVIASPQQVSVMNHICDLTEKFIEQYPEYEGELWLGAFCKIIAYSFHNSEFTYEQFCKEMDIMKEMYQHLWIPEKDVAKEEDQK